MSITIDFPKLTEEEFKGCSSESEKALELYWQYTLWDGRPAVGIDLACGGKPCVPWALAFDLPASEFDHYNSGAKPRTPLHVRGFADQNLPFESDSFAWVMASHILEDFTRDLWPRLLTEWSRIVRHGGHLIVLVPECERWNYAIRVLGQNPNCSHAAPEPSVGEVSAVGTSIGLEVITDRLTDQWPNDYGILVVLRKP